MEEERFKEILKEYGFNEEVAEEAWARRPVEKPDEKTVRDFAQALKYFIEFDLF